jgi:hypothetical protein
MTELTAANTARAQFEEGPAGSGGTLSMYTSDYDPELVAEVSLMRSEIDGALVVQVDTSEGVGIVRVNVNDAAVWMGDPETDDLATAHAWAIRHEGDPRKPRATECVRKASPSTIARYRFGMGTTISGGRFNRSAVPFRRLLDATLGALFDASHKFDAVLVLGDERLYYGEVVNFTIDDLQFADGVTVDLDDVREFSA